MKRTLWSILTAAAAAVLPGLAGPTADLAAAPVPEAAKPAPEAVQLRKAEVRTHDTRQDDLDDDPSGGLSAAVLFERTESIPSAPVALAAPPATPDVAPLARRSLGRPRVRAPDDRA